MKREGPFFVDGGTLPPDVPSYVERGADRELYERARRGELCYLLTPRRSGKSSLLVRLRERLRREGMRVAFVDLTMLGTGASAEEWCYGFCRSIARELELIPAFERWWAENASLPPILRLGECLRHCFLPASAAPLLVVVDEVETVRRLAFGDDFLAGVRASHNARAQDPEYARLSFVLSGVSTPADLIRDPERTPFNVGSRVDLTDFTAAEAAGLAAGLAGSCREPERVLAGILEWTQGHPYLTQRLCKAAMAHHTGPDEVDALVETELLSPRARGAEDHFKFVRERLLEGSHGRQVAALYGRVLAGKRIADDARSPVHGALRLSDLVSVDADGFLAPRNRILTTVFDREFVRRALRRSPAVLVTAASLAVALLTVLPGVFLVLPRGYVGAIDRAVNDAPMEEYHKLHRIPGWGRVANEHLGRFFDRRALATARLSDRDSAILFALRADTLASTPARRAQAAALFTPDLLALRRTYLAGGAVLAVAFSQRGDLVATAGEDGYVRVWESTVGRSPVAVMRLSSPVVAVAFSPDGRRLVTASSNAAQLWEADAGSGAPTASMEHKDRVVAVAFSSDSQRVLTGSWDGTARLWDTRGQPIGTPMEHQGAVNGAVFSPDGERVLTGSADGAARLWSGHDGAPIGAPMDQGSPVGAVLFSPREDRFLAFDELGAGRLWDANSRRLLRWLPTLSHAAAFSPDGERILVGSAVGEPAEGSVSFWDGSGETPYAGALAHTGGVEAVAFSPSGDLAATGSSDGAVQLWDARRGEPIGTPMEHLGKVTALAFSPDGTSVLSGSWDGTARLWATTGSREAPTLLRHNSRVRTAAFAPDGERVLTANDDQTARLWSFGSGSPLGPVFEHDDAVNAVAFSPDGRHVATASSDRTARIWDASDATALEVIQHRASVLSVAFSPDGARLLTGGVDGTARVWDVRDGQELGQPMRHKMLVSHAVFGADGKRLATASLDQRAQVWDAQSGARVGPSMPHQSPIEALALNRDSGLLLTTTRDAALLWDAKTGKALESQLGSPAVAGVEIESNGAAVFSADGTSAWTIGGRRLVLRWQIDGGGASLVGVVRRPGLPVGGAQAIWVDPADAAHVRFVSSMGGSASVEDVDLAHPPAGFDRPSDTLMRDLEIRFGLVLRDDGQISPIEASRVGGGF
jgi:WD40 repeat protein